MVTFYGSYKALLEETGRLSLPKNFYKAIDENEREGLYLTIEDDECIQAFPWSAWKKRMDNLSEQDPDNNPQVLHKVRLLNQRMKPVKVDKQGRLYLPPEMKERVGIEREVQLIGVITRFEIWRPERYKEYEQKKT